MAEDIEAQSAPPKRPRLAWSRGRWALLALAALGFAHWYVSRRSATETAARLHGAASQFAACVVGARPPDPGSPEAKRGLEAMLFKRLALSLSKAKPLEPCASLAASLKAQAQIHKDNFYHRSPNEVQTIATIADRLAGLDYTRDAAAWSTKPGTDAQSPTLELIADTNRLLELTCKVAQAEKVYDVGACPLAGEAARGVPDPRLALEVSLGEPIADFRMTLAANPAPRLAVATRGRRAKFGAWVAGAVAQPGSAASWRTLSLSLPDGPTAPPGRELPQLGLLASGQGLRVTESFGNAGRAFSVDDGLLAASSTLSVDRAVDTAAEQASRSSPPSTSVVPLAADTFAWILPATSGASTRVVYYDARGEQLSEHEYPGALLTATATPARLYLEQSGLLTAPLEAPGDQAADLAPALPLPEDLTLIETREMCGDERASALLFRGESAASLIRYPEGNAKPSTVTWPLTSGTRPNLICGACEARILEVTKDRLALRDPKDPKRAQQVDSPVLFGANAALRTEATCVDRTTLLAFVVGGALLVQRVTPEGSEAPVEVARPGEQGNATQPQLLLLSTGGGAPPRLVVFWRRAGGKTRADLLRIEFAESVDLGKTWH